MPEAGCVFRFGASKTGWGYGVILESDITLLIGIYKPIMRSNEFDPKRLNDATLLLSGWTQDGSFIDGDWAPVGRINPLPSIRHPEFKVNVEGKTWVTDYKANLRRLANAKEESELNFHFSLSPNLYEKAFWAHHGQGEWIPYFDKLTAFVEL